MQKINYKILAIILIIGAVCIFIGFEAGKKSAGKSWQLKLVEVQKETVWFKKLLEVFYPPLPKEIKSFGGTITKIEGKSFWVEAVLQVSQFPLPEGKETEKRIIKVNTNEKTEISAVQIIFPPPPPEESEEKIIILKIEDLKVGENVSVSAEENIINKTEITAKQVQVSR